MEFIDLQKQYRELEKEINYGIKNVLEHGKYIMGPEVQQLEKELCNFTGSKYCLTCANGTDALQMALMALGIGPGDAVFVPSFTFMSTAEVVNLVGATPVFADINIDTFNLDPESFEHAVQKTISKGDLKPKAVIPVDLFGQCADYEKIIPIAKKHGLFVIEDAAQGFGGSINGKMACSFGDISTTSFFPAKPLGCYGDGGAVLTNDDDMFQLMSSIRVHGKGTMKYDNVRVGLNSRLDTIQAAILLPKLHAFISSELELRNKWAAQYTILLKDKVRILMFLTAIYQAGHNTRSFSMTAGKETASRKNLRRRVFPQTSTTPNLCTCRRYISPLATPKVRFLSLGKLRSAS